MNDAVEHFSSLLSSAPTYMYICECVKMHVCQHACVCGEGSLTKVLASASNHGRVSWGPCVIDYCIAGYD